MARSHHKNGTNHLKHACYRCCQQIALKNTEYIRLHPQVYNGKKMAHPTIICGVKTASEVFPCLNGKRSQLIAGSVHVTDGIDVGDICALLVVDTDAATFEKNRVKCVVNPAREV